MNFERFFLILLIVAAVIGFQQYSSFTTQSQQLKHHLQMSKRNVVRIETTMYDESLLLKELDEAEVRYRQLRTLLPESLLQAEFDKTFTQLAEQNGIKILAKTQAIYGHPSYREAVTSVTLETGDAAAQSLFDALNTLPRIINISDKKRTDAEHLELSLRIYSLDPAIQSDEQFPACIDAPSGVWMPLWKTQLDERYAEYTENCAFIQNFGAIHFKQERLKFLRAEIERVEATVNQLSGKVVSTD